MSDESRTIAQSRWQGLTTARRAQARLSHYTSKYYLMAFFTAQVIGLTFLQKFALQIQFVAFGNYISVGSVQLCMVIFYAGLFGLFLFLRPKIDIVRLALFACLLASITISIILQKAQYSQASVLLAVACYAPFMIEVEVDGASYRRMLNIFLNVMLIMAVIVFTMQAVQAIWTWRLWPNLNELVPAEFLLPSFNYIQPVLYGSRMMKPHAIFFLEVSTVSQFLAIALAIEMIYFRRFWRAGTYVAALILTFAGTGPLLLLLCAPVLLAKLSWRSILMVLLIFAVGYFAAERVHWYQQVQGRFTEYRMQGSSAHLRFVDPMVAIADAVSQPGHLLSGIGAGNTAKDDGTVSWAVTKVTVEYGVLSLVTFCAFIGYVLFRNAPSQRMAFVLLAFFNFMGGGIVIPMYPIMIFLLGGMFRITPEGRVKRRRERGKDPSTDSRKSGEGRLEMKAAA